MCLTVVCLQNCETVCFLWAEQWNHNSIEWILHCDDGTHGNWLNNLVLNLVNVTKSRYECCLVCYSCERSRSGVWRRRFRWFGKQREHEEGGEVNGSTAEEGTTSATPCYTALCDGGAIRTLSITANDRPAKTLIYNVVVILVRHLRWYLLGRLKCFPLVKMKTPRHVVPLPGREDQERGFVVEPGEHGQDAEWGHEGQGDGDPQLWAVPQAGEGEGGAREPRSAAAHAAFASLSIIIIIITSLFLDTRSS